MNFDLVDENNIDLAAFIHSVSWKESHRAFCSAQFVEQHTQQRQKEYLLQKMKNGTKIYILNDKKSVGIISVTKNLIEDLYILSEEQNKGYGTKLLQFAMQKCDGIPTLWILENNIRAEKLYRKIGFVPSGNIKSIAEKLCEIEFVYK